MESPRAFIAISFLMIVGIVNGFRINNGDIPVDGAGGVPEIIESDEAEVASSVASLWDSLLVAELKRIIEDQKASGNEESLERISRQAPPEPEKPNQPETQTETQPETQTETQPETQAETQPETQPETQAEIQWGTQLGTQPDLPDIRFRQCYFNPISCFKK